MFIIYDPVVDIVRSRLVINSFTLLTRLGGTIGITKELLWLFLLSVSAIKIASAILTHDRGRDRQIEQPDQQ